MPAQAPLQPPKTEVPLAEAFRVIWVLAGNTWPQLGFCTEPQLMPGPVTTPAPLPMTVA